MVSPSTQRRRRQLNLRGGKNSIWNMADKSYGMDAIEAAKKAPKLPAHSGQVSASRRTAPTNRR